MQVVSGGEMPEFPQEYFSRDSFLVNMHLNNNTTLFNAMQGILLCSVGDRAEMQIADLVEKAIEDGTITDKINLWMVNWKKIVFINSNDENND